MATGGERTAAAFMFAVAVAVIAGLIVKYAPAGERSHAASPITAVTVAPSTTTNPSAATALPATATTPLTTRTVVPTSPSPPRPKFGYLAAQGDQIQQDSYEACGYVETGPYVVSRTTYGQSVGLRMNCVYSSAWVWADYNVPAGCTTFLTTVGLADDSPTGASLLFEVLRDGSPAYSASLGLAQAQSVALPLGSTFRLRLRITFTYNGHPLPDPTGIGNGFVGVFGNARFQCT
jgi:hypothetical protein